MNQHRCWRPPWEEVETRTGGYYGRPGCPTEGCAGWTRGPPPQDGIQNSSTCTKEAPGRARQKRHDQGRFRQRELQYRPPSKHYCVHDRERWYDGDGYRAGQSDDFGRNFPEPNDSRYPPPTNPRFSHGPYPYDHRSAAYAHGRGGDCAYGVGTPIRDDGGVYRGSLPSITRSTTSTPTDDSSNSSQDPRARRNASRGVARNTGTHPLSGVARIGSEAPAERTTIELIPGVEVEVRGAKETWQAFQEKFYVDVTCIGCSANVRCIQDADYVVCPDCRVVSPLESSKPSQGRIGGLGLGFIMDKTT